MHTITQIVKCFNNNTFITCLFAEVCAGIIRDVAKGRFSWQSTTQGSNNASLAVDGSDGTCAITSEEKGSRWSIDLGGVHTVISVVISAGRTIFNSLVFFNCW